MAVRSALSAAIAVPRAAYEQRERAGGREHPRDRVGSGVRNGGGSVRIALPMRIGGGIGVPAAAASAEKPGGCSRPSCASVMLTCSVFRPWKMRTARVAADLPRNRSAR